MTINIDDLILEFGEQYIPGGQTAKSIKQQLYAVASIEEDFRMVPENGSHYVSVYSSISEVLQAFSIPFVTKGNLTFQPVKYELGEFKIDAQISPDKLWKSWLGFLAELNEVDRSKWTFIQWVIQNKLIPKAKEDYIKNVIYRGWKKTGFNASPTVDGATFTREFSSENIQLPANASMDGILTILRKLSSRVNIVTLGAFSTTPLTFVGQVETFVDALPQEARDQIDFIYMSEYWRNIFREGNRQKYFNGGAAIDKTLLDQIFNKESITVKVDPSMTSTSKLWCTPKDNRVRPTKVDASGRFDIQKDGRLVNVMTNWAKALVFDVPELVYTNELEMTISSGDLSTYYPTL